jgi:hypothetical protein
LGSSECQAVLLSVTRNKDRIENSISCVGIVLTKGVRDKAKVKLQRAYGECLGVKRR